MFKSIRNLPCRKWLRISVMFMVLWLGYLVFQKQVDRFFDDFNQTFKPIIFGYEFDHKLPVKDKGVIFDKRVKFDFNCSYKFRVRKDAKRTEPIDIKTEIYTQNGQLVLSNVSHIKLDKELPENRYNGLGQTYLYKGEYRVIIRNLTSLKASTHLNVFAFGSEPFVTVCRPASKYTVLVKSGSNVHFEPYFKNFPIESNLVKSDKH